MMQNVMLMLLMMIVLVPFLLPSQFFGSSGEIILTGPDFTRKFHTVGSSTADSIEIRVCDATGVVYMAESLHECEHLISEKDMSMMLPTTRSFFVTKETAQAVNKYTCRPDVAVMRVPVRIDHPWYGLLTSGLLFYTSIFFILRFFSLNKIMHASTGLHIRSL